MKTLIVVFGLIAGMLLAGCVDTRESEGTLEEKIGPMIVGGVTYYPAKPDAVYENVLADFTTNPPPAGADDFAFVVSTNGIGIHLIDGPARTATKMLSER